MAYASKINLISCIKQVISRDVDTGFKCSKNEEIDKIIQDAIDIGAPLYNSGDHIGCYRVYDAASYKILYLYGDDCSEIKNLLTTCIKKCSGDYSDIEKAWMMRAAFDKILGQPTITVPINNG
jgi:hypothetical protein